MRYDRDMNGAVSKRDPKTGQFLTGNRGGGRKKGSRNRLGERFIEDIFNKWRTHGTDVLDRVIKDEPATFLRVVSQVIPRELDATVNVNVGLFAEIKDYLEAYRIAKQYIGAEDPLLIEGKADREQ